MRDIYMPNCFRISNMRRFENGNSVSEIPYFLNFNFNDDTHLKLLINLAISNVIENILLFDRVYIDIFELPIVLKELYQSDKNGTIDLIKKGYIASINLGELIVSSNKINDKYTLAASIGKFEKAKSLTEFEDFIISYDKVLEEIRPYLSNIYNNSKNTKNKNLDIKKIGIKIVNKVDKELKEGKYQCIGIGGENFYLIENENKGIFDAICQLTRDEYIRTSFNIEKIYYNDLLLKISGIINEEGNLNENFGKILKFNDIPDISKMYLEGKIDISNILELKKKKVFKIFQSWIFDVNRDLSCDIIKEYHKAVVAESKLESIPVKVLTTIIGFIPYVGNLVGIGELILEESNRRKRPDKFIKKLSTKINNIKETDLVKVEVPIREKINIKRYKI